MKTDEEARLEAEIAHDETQLDKLYDVVRDVRDHYNTKEIEMMSKRRQLYHLRQSRSSK